MNCILDVVKLVLTFLVVTMILQLLGQFFLSFLTGRYMLMSVTYFQVIKNK